MLAGASVAAPRAVLAQGGRRFYRVAILDDSVESVRDQSWRLFRNRLSELVLADGDDVAYEARFARGDAERLPALAAELVALKPDAIVCSGTPPTSAARRATSSIPIVFAGAGDPVGSGLVASLARPGGNVTGVSSVTAPVATKQLELLREMFPAAKRLGYLTNASNRAAVATYRHVEQQARIMKVTVQMLDGRKRAELEKSFETIKREGLQGLLVGAAIALLEHRDRIVEFAAREKLPVAYGRREYVDAGGLVSYSVDLRFTVLRSAEFVHRILKGAKPADLPVEQSSNTLMLLNLKAARALGVKIPESVRLRANEVIQ